MKSTRPRPSGLRSAAAKYSIDATRIAAVGGSAGGHLAALLGTSDGVKDLEDPLLGYAEVSGAVQAVVDWFGPTDFLKMDEQLLESKVKNPQVHSIPDSPESELIGKNLEEAPELVRKANPETYITPDDPPFFIQHGLTDNLVPYQQSVNLAEKLEIKLGKEKVTLKLFPGTGHGGPAFLAADNLENIFRFLDSYLK